MDHQAFAQLLGNYGEFVGAIAVVATLAYLAIQVRQSNKIETAESIRSTTNAYVSTILQVNSPLFRRAMIDFEGLSGDDQMTIHNYLIAMFFVIFDLETIFIFGWAVAFYELDVTTSNRPVLIAERFRVVAGLISEIEAIFHPQPSQPEKHGKVE